MRQYVGIHALAFTAGVVAVENGLARTPQMGWVWPHACPYCNSFRTAELMYVVTEQLEHFRMRCVRAFASRDFKDHDRHRTA